MYIYEDIIRGKNGWLWRNAGIVLYVCMIDTQNEYFCSRNQISQSTHLECVYYIVTYKIESFFSLTFQVAFVTSHVRDLIKKVQSKTYPTSKVKVQPCAFCNAQNPGMFLSNNVCYLQGLSFLDLRYHLLLFYLQDVAHVMSVKADGQSLEDNDAIHRLVTIRTVRISQWSAWIQWNIKVMSNLFY